ncbi:GPI-anchored protein LLG1-like [Rhododendron vialii]|uniref:GPI-anchored protein LLG1-like n=1 Tax=Rhododendron vialii TaxID=182163 RepID=UPI00265E5C4C|nr:GPI-anchored protein LLG1-like [Rhododendron vialii]
MEHKNPYLSPFSSPFLLLVFFLLVGVFFLAAGFSVSASASASTFISDDVFEDRASFGRNLLQTKNPCPVNFEFLNYTIVTSQCKGPLYLPSLCCGALTEFACPYVDDLNDLTNDCASTMFSYINLYGKYPPGLFASECKDGKQGLACNGTSASAPTSGSQIVSIPSLLVLLSTGFLVLLLLFL